MITRQELVSYVHELLSCTGFKDYAPNGLQVQGSETIGSIATAVTASADVIKQTGLLGANALLVHHGYFWRGENPEITGIKHARISALISKNINLLAYHLPLDCHSELGNNACLGQLLDMVSLKSYTIDAVPNLLWSGFLKKPQSAVQFSLFLGEKLGQSPIHIAGSDKLISRVAWCTGAAQDYIEHANDLAVDAYISGEVSERTYYQAKELGIHYFSCGHHATERYGIQALGQHLAAHFGLEHHFIDSDNPV